MMSICMYFAGGGGDSVTVSLIEKKINSEKENEQEC